MGWERTYSLLKQLIHLGHDLMDIGFRGAKVGDASAQHLHPARANVPRSHFRGNFQMRKVPSPVVANVFPSGEKSQCSAL
jgi:hypothetical protein